MAMAMAFVATVALASCSGVRSGGGWGGAEPVTRPAGEPRSPTVDATPRTPVSRGSTLPYEGIKVRRLDDRHFSPEEYWEIAGPIVESGPFEVEEIGRSVEGRPLRLVEYGDGPVSVLLWSQMHGDESTASMALVDLFNFFAEQPDHPVVQRIRSGVRASFIPVLNPDGAARFQRRNAFGIDVNRDARALVTPEGRALKAVHERLSPEFGFNLHDQGVHIRVGDTDRGAAIALLAPAFDETRRVNALRGRAMQVASVIATAIEPMVGGHITRYNDAFNPRAFGDLMATWGTSTVLIESGGWADDPEKQYLRHVNFEALVTALDAIATGAYADVSRATYDALPENGRRVADLLVLGGTLVLPTGAMLQADLLLDYADPYYETGARVRDVGDLEYAGARDTLDVSGLYLVPDDVMLDRSYGDPQFAPGMPAHFEARRAPDAARIEWHFDGELPRSLRGSR